jgi:hypothetical protein
MGRVRAVPRLCELYPGICLTAEEKARKNLSQGRTNSELRGILQRTDAVSTVNYLQLRITMKERKIIEGQNKLQQQQWKEQ